MSKIAILSGTPNGLSDKIQAIKALRGLTGLGLKESKEMVEAAAAGTQQRATISSNDPDAVNSLRLAGLNITIIQHDHPSRTHIAGEIQKITTYATLAGQYDLAKVLIDVLEMYCPVPETKEEES